MRKCLGAIALLLVVAACSKPEAPTSHIHYTPTPAGLPVVEYPADNAFSDARWRLGKALFFDTRLSIGNDVSCASCHHPDHFFTDNLATTPGTLGRAGKRNSPSLMNVAYHPYYTREGGVATLEQQILVPIQEHNEFGHNIVAIGEELALDARIYSMSMAAYGQAPNPYTVTRSIATFERSLVAASSAYDRYLSGQTNALNPDEAAGMQLFFSETTGCSDCHGGPLFSEFEVVNNGLYFTFDDPGLFNLTSSPSDSGKFKVPSFRNVAATPPYMHDGSLLTLEAVLAHYMAGGQSHSNQDARVHPFELSATEQAQLISFLHALTDDHYPNQLQH